jgi:hypothetical protein
MRIYNKVIIDMTTLDTLYEEYYEYDGPIAYCFDGDDEEAGMGDVGGTDVGSDVGGETGMGGDGVGTESDISAAEGGPSEQAGGRGAGMGMGGFGDQTTGTGGEPVTSGVNIGVNPEDPISSQQMDIMSQHPSVQAIDERQQRSIGQAAKDVASKGFGVSSAVGMTREIAASVKEVEVAKGVFGSKAVDDYMASKGYTSDPSGRGQGLGATGGMGTGDIDVETEDTGLTGTGRGLDTGDSGVTDDDLLNLGYNQGDVDILKSAPKSLQTMSPFLMSRYFPTYYELLYTDPTDLAQQRRERQLEVPTGYGKREGFGAVGIGGTTLGRRT